MSKILKNPRILFVFILIFKIVVIFLFTSDYPTHLFVPFLKNAIQNFPTNPWQLTIQANQSEAFPYHPLLLYGLFLWEWIPVSLQSSDNVLRIWLGFASFLPDIVILNLLLKWFPNRPRAVLGIYFFSPIIIYSTYIHGLIGN